MIDVRPSKNLVSKLPADVLERLSHPASPGNEALLFLIEWATEVRGKIRSNTENLQIPVLDVELRQSRGALHVLDAIIDTPAAAKLILEHRAARAAEEEKKSQRGKP